MANLKFNVKVFVENAGTLEELRSRMADLSPAFEAIFLEWVKLNETEKFASSKGMESSGADVDGEFWHGLTPDYMKEKHPGGAPRQRRRRLNAQGYREYPDWLMVRSGALMEAMSNPDALFQYFDPQKAVYGTPLDPDLSDIVQWQAGERQGGRNVVFLGMSDMNTIRRVIQDYLGIGGDFAQYRNAEAMSHMNLESEIEDMDAEFAGSAS